LTKGFFIPILMI